MKIGTILITLLLIGGFVSGFAGFYGALASQYGMTSHNFTSMSRAEQIANDTSSMMGIVNSSQSDTSAGNYITLAPTNLLFGAYHAAMLVFNTPMYFISIFSDLMSVIGLPNWVSPMIIGIIGIIVLFALIEFITGRPTGS